MEPLAVVHVVCYSCNIVISISAVLLNSLFITALKRKRSFYSPATAILGCLCCSDLVVGVVTLPAWIANITLHNTPLYDLQKLTWLRLLGYVGVAFANLSVHFIAMVNLDRYVAIIHPFTYVTHATCNLWIIISICSGTIWLVLMAVMYVLHEVLDLETDYIITFIFYSIMATTIIYCNWNICGVILKQRRAISSNGKESQGHHQRFSFEKKQYYLVVFLILILILCKIPFLMSFLYRRFSSKGHMLARGILSICSDFGIILNSLLSPLVYYLRLRMFQIAVKEVLCCR